MKKHLSVANVLSCLALFVALSGAAYAAGLGNNAVRTRNIANNAVNTAKLRNNAVNTAKLRNNAVNARKLRNGSVTGPKIANAAVGTSKLADASVRSTTLGGGVVTTGKLKDLGVTEAKLGNNAVTSTKISAGSVETGKLAKEAVTGEKLSAGLLAQLLKNVSYESKSSPSDKEEFSKEVVAECTAGKIAIGGGARITGGGATQLVLSGSYPQTNPVSGKTDAWVARALPLSLVADDWAVVAHVICAEL